MRSRSWILIAFILTAAGAAFSSAAEPAPKEPAAASAGVDPELSAKADETVSRLTVLMVDIDKDSLAELQRKLQLLKAARKELGGENMLRLEIIDEFRKTQYGLQALVLGQNQEPGEKEKKIAAMERIGKLLSASASETDDSRAAKKSLAEFRAALAAFSAANNGAFPESPDQLADKYLRGIPLIRLPGHGARTNAVEIVQGVKNTEELFQKVNDSGGWLYVGDRTSPIRGTVIFNCNHKDYNGTAMFRY